MSIVRTLAHDQILNFFPCTETAGTTITSEGGVALSPSTIGFGTSNAVTLKEATPEAPTAGAFSSFAAGSDMLVMVLINLDNVTASSLQMGGTQGISMTNDSSLQIKGVTGTLELAGVQAAATVVTRIIMLYRSGGITKAGTAATGTDVTLHATDFDSTDAGDLTSFTNIYSSNTFGNSVALYGFQMVEFPSGGMGANADVLAKANATIALWEAGNKAHYPILA